MSFRPVPPLTPEEREQLRPRPPQASDTLRACRNLAHHSPPLHRDGITTELREEATSVIVTRGDLSILLTATPHGWIPMPDIPTLRLPLDATVPLQRHLHTLSSPPVLPRRGSTALSPPPPGTPPGERSVTVQLPRAHRSNNR